MTLRASATPIRAHKTVFRDSLSGRRAATNRNTPTATPNPMSVPPIAGRMEPPSAAAKATLIPTRTIAKRRIVGPLSALRFHHTRCTFSLTWHHSNWSMPWPTSTLACLTFRRKICADGPTATSMTPSAHSGEVPLSLACLPHLTGSRSERYRSVPRAPLRGKGRTSQSTTTSAARGVSPKKPCRASDPIVQAAGPGPSRLPLRAVFDRP